MIAGGRPNLIGISGKIGNGKDLLFDVINYIVTEDYWNSFEHYMHESTPVDEVYENKKFAYPIKWITAVLIGCDIRQLEDREFKEKELGEEWGKYELISRDFAKAQKLNERYYDKSYYTTLDDAERMARMSGLLDYSINKISMTPRLLLQLLGTEAGRHIIHPNIWVNALFADYKHVWNDPDPIEGNDYNITYRKDYPNTEESLIQYGGGSEAEVFTREIEESKWIITDVRFPNEAKAIKDRGGIVIRVNRDSKSKYIYKDFEVKQKLMGMGYVYSYNEDYSEDAINEGFEYSTSLNKWSFDEDVINEHASETALDDYDGFDYVIENDGTVQDLIDKVKSLNIVKRIL